MQKAAWGKYILGLAVFGGLLAAISLWTAAQMQEMQTELREDQIGVLSGDKAKPGRETVAYYWDPELLVAQQIDRVLRLNRPEAARPILESIEQNIPYNRNKPAAYFYLAEACAAQGDKDKAKELYLAALNNFNNRNISIYPSAQNIREDTPAYAVSLQEEALLRLYFLTGETEYLDRLLNGGALFGPENKPGFLYADLAAANLAAGVRVTAQAFLAHLTAAENYLRRYIQLIQAEDLLAAGQLVSGGAGRALAADTAQIKSLKYQETLTLTLEEIRKDKNAYLYVFLYNEADLRFTLRGDLDDRLTIERIQRGK
ncbi:MAG: hypothetical protein LBD99_03400 [Candidatus Margulisbacteria bacterium]|jgi:tetratricopeptide (TPR) repeat protein|nr:hypothetical protein [Candidatus Margulisiibacteriota bacterium]